MKHSDKHSPDQIDNIMESSWESMPPELKDSLANIPAQETAAALSPQRVLDLFLNFLVYAIVYVWLAGMVFIFQSALLNSVSKLGGLIQKMTPQVNLPVIDPWIPLGLLIMAGLIFFTRFLPPLEVNRREGHA